MTTTSINTTPDPVQRLIAAVKNLLSAREDAMLTADEWHELEAALAECEKPEHAPGND